MNAREYVDNFARRLISEAVCSATPEQYERRAAQLEAIGTGRCREAAQACRNAAELWRRYGPELIADDLDNVWAEFEPRGWAA